MLLNKSKTFDDILLLFIKRVYKYDQTISMLKRARGTGKNIHSIADASRCTLLHFSAQYANCRVAKYLITIGAKVNAQDSQGKTALMKVISSEAPVPGKIDTIEVLLNANASIHLRDGNGNNVWQMISSSEASIVESLANKLREECSDSSSIAEKLIDDDCPLPIAVLTGDAKVVKLMLDRGCPVVNPRTQESALHVAIDRLDADVLQAILEHGADVHSRNNAGCTPLSWLDRAYQNTERHLSVLKSLLDHGALKFDYGEEMPIGSILARGDRQAIALLSRYGLDFRAKDAKGRTALHYLAHNDDGDVLEEIRGKKMDVNRVDSEGHTALHVSVMQGTTRFAEFLMENGADVNSAGNGSTKPALFMAYSLFAPFPTKSRIVEALLRHGADPQVRHEGRTMFEEPPETHVKELVLEPIFARLVLLEALGASIDASIVEQIHRQLRLKWQYELFNRQIERMANYRMCESTSLFTLLTMSERRFACYMRNRDLAAKFVKLAARSLALNSGTYYYSVLQARLAEAVETTELRKRVAKVIFEISGFHFDAHHVIVDSILGNFSMQDLRKFG